MDYYSKQPLWILFHRLGSSDTPTLQRRVSSAGRNHIDLITRGRNLTVSPSLIPRFPANISPPLLPRCRAQGQNVTGTRKIIKMKMPEALKAQTPESASIFRSNRRATVCYKWVIGDYFCCIPQFYTNWGLNSQWCVAIHELKRSANPCCVILKNDTIAGNMFSPLSVLHGCVIRLSLVIACIICYWRSVQTQPGANSHKCKYCFQITELAQRVLWEMR